MNRKLIAALVASLALPFAAMAADETPAPSSPPVEQKSEAKTQKSDTTTAPKKATKKKVQPRKGHKSEKKSGAPKAQ